MDLESGGDPKVSSPPPDPVTDFYCKHCGEFKKPNRVHTAPPTSTAAGRKTCKDCSNKKQKQYYERHREERKAYSRERHRKRRHLNAQYYRNLPREVKARRIQQKRFKRNCWTKALYDECFAKQKGICAVKGCSRPIHSADHCHTTKQPRELLCRRCNTTLGLLDEDPSVIRGLASYAKKWHSVLGTSPRT